MILVATLVRARMVPGNLRFGPLVDPGCAWPLARTGRTPSSSGLRPPLPWYALLWWSPTAGRLSPVGSVSFGLGCSPGVSPLLGVGPGRGLLGSAAPPWRTRYGRFPSLPLGAALSLLSLCFRGESASARCVDAPSGVGKTSCARAADAGSVTRSAFGSVTGRLASTRVWVVSTSWLGGAPRAFALAVSRRTSVSGSSRSGSRDGNALPWFHSRFHFPPPHSGPGGYWPPSAQ